MIKDIIHKFVFKKEREEAGIFDEQGVEEHSEDTETDEQTLEDNAMVADEESFMSKAASPPDTDAILGAGDRMEVVSREMLIALLQKSAVQTVSVPLKLLEILKWKGGATTRVIAATASSTISASPTSAPVRTVMLPKTQSASAPFERKFKKASIVIGAVNYEDDSSDDEVASDPATLSQAPPETQQAVGSVASSVSEKSAAASTRKLPTVKKLSASVGGVPGSGEKISVVAKKRPAAKYLPLSAASKKHISSNNGTHVVQGRSATFQKKSSVVGAAPNKPNRVEARSAVPNKQTTIADANSSAATPVAVGQAFASKPRSGGEKVSPASDARSRFLHGSSTPKIRLSPKSPSKPAQPKVAEQAITLKVGGETVPAKGTNRASSQTRPCLSGKPPAVVGKSQAPLPTQAKLVVRNNMPKLSTSPAAVAKVVQSKTLPANTPIDGSPPASVPPKVAGRPNIPAAATTSSVGKPIQPKVAATRVVPAVGGVSQTSVPKPVQPKIPTSKKKSVVVGETLGFPVPNVPPTKELSAKSSASSFIEAAQPQVTAAKRVPAVESAQRIAAAQTSVPTAVDGKEVAKPAQHSLPSTQKKLPPAKKLSTESSASSVIKSAQPQVAAVKRVSAVELPQRIAAQTSVPTAASRKEISIAKPAQDSLPSTQKKFTVVVEKATSVTKVTHPTAPPVKKSTSSSISVQATAAPPLGSNIKSNVTKTTRNTVAPLQRAEDLPKVVEAASPNSPMMLSFKTNADISAQMHSCDGESLMSKSQSKTTLVTKRTGEQDARKDVNMSSMSVPAVQDDDAKSDFDVFKQIYDNAISQKKPEAAQDAVQDSTEAVLPNLLQKQQDAASKIDQLSSQEQASQSSQKSNVRSSVSTLGEITSPSTPKRQGRPVAEGTPDMCSRDSTVPIESPAWPSDSSTPERQGATSGPYTKLMKDSAAVKVAADFLLLQPDSSTPERQGATAGLYSKLLQEPGVGAGVILHARSAGEEEPKKVARHPPLSSESENSADESSKDKQVQRLTPKQHSAKKRKRKAYLMRQLEEHVAPGILSTCHKPRVFPGQLNLKRSQAQEVAGLLLEQLRDEMPEHAEEIPLVYKAREKLKKELPNCIITPDRCERGYYKSHLDADFVDSFQNAMPDCIKIKSAVSKKGIAFISTVAATLSHTHYDQDTSFLLMLTGTKEIFYAPPSMGTLIRTDHPVISHSSNFEGVNPFVELTGTSWRFAKLNAGDGLLLPQGWLHAVKSLPGTVAISFQIEAAGTDATSPFLRRNRETAPEDIRHLSHIELEEEVKAGTNKSGSRNQLPPDIVAKGIANSHLTHKKKLTASIAKPAEPKRSPPVEHKKGLAMAPKSAGTKHALPTSPEFKKGFRRGFSKPGRPETNSFAGGVANKVPSAKLPKPIPRAIGLPTRALDVKKQKSNGLRRSSREKLVCGVFGCGRDPSVDCSMWVLVLSIDTPAALEESTLPAVPTNHPKHLVCTECCKTRESGVIEPEVVLNNADRAAIKGWDQYLYYSSSKVDYQKWANHDGKNGKILQS